MSETINTTMYDRVDEVRNLNRIEGFDPRQYMRNLTGSDGTVSSIWMWCTVNCGSA